MNIAGIRHALLRSSLARFVALTVMVLIAFACLTDLAGAAHAASCDCPEGTLKDQHAPAISFESAVLPERIEALRASNVGRVRDTTPVVATPFVLARPASPRAPPIA